MARRSSNAATRESAPVRAHGRSLADFDKLRPAEQALLDCCRQGEIAQVSPKCPTEESDANSVRASFVRFLLLGGDEKAPVHEHGVQLVGAWLEGILDLDAGTSDHRLALASCRIERIEARHTKIKALNLQGSRLLKGMTCDGLRTQDIYLRRGFHANGEVQFTGVIVEGDVDLSNARFENGNDIAISFERARISGGLDFRDAKIEGDVDLADAHVTSLFDSAATWDALEGKLILDGFVYTRLGSSPTDASFREHWLAQQRVSHLGDEFKPQPWEQLILVLRATGHPLEARKIAIAKQHRLRQAKKVVFGARTLHWLYGSLVGYGYRPSRLLLAAASVWIFCFAAYLMAANPQWFGSTAHLLAPASDRGAVCRAAGAASNGGDACSPPAPDYENFVPLIYSADVLLPIVDLGYQSQWQPVVSRDGHSLIWGQLLRFVYWTEIFLGWIFGGALVAMLGNLIKRD